MTEQEPTNDEITIEQKKGAKKNIVLDASMLSELMACPRKLDLRYNHRFVSQNGKSNSLEVGSLVHVVFETYISTLLTRFVVARVNSLIGVKDDIQLGFPQDTNFFVLVEYPCFNYFHF
jgi:CRISPR/Cas system-associated exonuclease Cas4 (RecB family)